MYDMTNEERIAAIYNAVPQVPQVIELGGGFYFRCHWLKCNNTVTRHQNFCDQCGQKIDWEGLKWKQLQQCWKK